MIPLDSLSRDSVFFLVMKREDGSLFPMEFKFRKFNRKANSCEWSRFGTSIQDVRRASSIDFISRKAFATIGEAHEKISSAIPAKD